MSTLYTLVTECRQEYDEDGPIDCRDTHEYQLAHMCIHGDDGAMAGIVLRDYGYVDPKGGNSDFDGRLVGEVGYPSDWATWKRVLADEGTRVVDQYGTGIGTELFIIMVERYTSRTSRQSHYRHVMAEAPDMVLNGRVSLDPQGYTRCATDLATMPHVSEWIPERRDFLPHGVA